MFAIIFLGFIFLYFYGGLAYIVSHKEKESFKKFRKITGKKQQFCVRGHDTFICGRTKDRHCKNCVRIQDKKREQRVKSFESKETIKITDKKQHSCCSSLHQNRHHGF